MIQFLDRENIRKVHLRAFSEGENQIISTIALNMLSEETSPETIALVAETDVLVALRVAVSFWVAGNSPQRSRFRKIECENIVCILVA